MKPNTIEISKFFRQIKTKEESPKKWGWYATDKGKLFWYHDMTMKEGIWSCRDDQASEEYPSYWYEPFDCQQLLKEKEAELSSCQSSLLELANKAVELNHRLDKQSELMERMAVELEYSRHILLEDAAESKAVRTIDNILTDFKNLKG